MRPVAILALILASDVLAMSAQTPSPTPRARPRTTSAKITVRNNSGTPLENVRIAISGTASRSTTTDASGVATVPLDAGSYRLRFDSNGFITVERDVTIQAGRTAEIDVVLDLAPPPPEAPAPPPPPPPAPAPKPVAPTVAAGPPVNISLPAFLDENFIGRGPLRESVLGCTESATTRVLQLRDPLAVHTHQDMDEVIYVIAGEGTARIREESITLAPGTLNIIPRGVPHAIERRGKNPLILLSTLAGAPCTANQPRGPQQ